MNNFFYDAELKKAVREINLDKPGPDFTKLVMNQVHEIAAEKVKAAQKSILDSKFWIFVSLFFILGVGLIILSTYSSGDSLWGNLLPSLKDSPVGKEYNSMMGWLAQIPASVAAILIASSTLIFIERFISQKQFKRTE